MLLGTLAFSTISRVQAQVSDPLAPVSSRCISVDAETASVVKGRVCVGKIETLGDSAIASGLKVVWQSSDPEEMEILPFITDVGMRETWLNSHYSTLQEICKEIGFPKYVVAKIEALQVPERGVIFRKLKDRKEDRFEFGLIHSAITAIQCEK